MPVRFTFLFSLGSGRAAVAWPPRQGDLPWWGVACGWAWACGLGVTPLSPQAAQAQAWQAAPQFWAANAPKAKANPKSAPGLPAIPEFDPLVPDADFGAPVPVSQTQYLVVGPAGIKPVQVYNDARNTHIALADILDRPSVLVPARGGLHPHQAWVRGNQMLVRGVPSEIVLAYPDGRHVSIMRVTQPTRLAKSPQLPPPGDDRPATPAPVIEGTPMSSIASSPQRPVLDASGPEIERARSAADQARAALFRTQQEALQRTEQLNLQQQQVAVLNDQLRMAQIRIQELQEQALTEQTQKLQAQAVLQEAQAQKQEALSQMQALQTKVAERQAAALAQTPETPVLARPRSQPESMPGSAPVVATVAAAPVANVDAAGWILQAGETVSGAMSRWAVASGRQLVWSPKVDVPIRRAKVYAGSLESALQQLAQDLSKTLPILVQVESQFILVGIAP
ncbi:MAG: TcpQ domain-containing protein [Alphaproteobacteria bacterium]|nr:TcpQ domain-containing protein [Alphaproteobacteria bacterium]